MQKSRRAAAFLGVVLGATAFATAQVNPPTGFFDWDTNDNPGTNFQVSPFISDNPAQLAAARQALDKAVAKGRPLAVKVNTQLNTAAARNIFNQYPISYVFADFEDADSITQTRAISSLVLNSTRSQSAFVGNFNVYPNASQDPTRPGTVISTADSFSPQNQPATGQYGNIRAFKGTQGSNRMANEALYPGAPDFRNPRSGNSNAPNVRSALFTLPIVRAGFVTDNLQYNNGLHRHIPWVSRFNNYGNAAMTNVPGDAQHQFKFVQNAANPADGQLPSRGDFQAQILHYRLRGANSVNLFEANELDGHGSVIGYTRGQARQDVITGWAPGGSAVGGIFSRNNFAFANLGPMVTLYEGGPQHVTSESVGTIWSGVFDKSGAGRRLSVLLSNLGNGDRMVDLPNDIGGHRTNGGDGTREDDYFIRAGSHRLLDFTLSGGLWQLDRSSAIFTDNNRNGVGVPEPATLGLLGMGALGLLVRRRRRVA